MILGMTPMPSVLLGIVMVALRLNPGARKEEIDEEVL